jgi:hypothetical protein
MITSVGWFVGFFCQWQSPRTRVPGSVSNSRGKLGPSLRAGRGQKFEAMVIACGLRRGLRGWNCFTFEMLKGRESPRNSLEINAAREAPFVRFRPRASQMRDGKRTVNRFPTFREHSQGEFRI